MPQFILAVSGSRSITSPAEVHRLLDEAAAEVICSGRTLELRLGDAAGVDAHALHWARANRISRRICFADRRKWDRWWTENIHSGPTLPPGVSRLESHHNTAGCVYYTDGTFESAEISSDWERDGLTMAGSKRNAAMLYGHPLEGIPAASRLLAIHDGVSTGTENCIRQAELMEIEVQYELVLL